MKIEPRIISRLTDSAEGVTKPYYEIMYYDTDLKDAVIGYGSFNRKFVEQWLRDDFPKTRDDGMTDEDYILFVKVLAAEVGDKITLKDAVRIVEAIKVLKETSDSNKNYENLAVPGDNNGSF